MAALTLLPACALTAAEYATEAERLQFEVRKSSDRATQLLGERWNNLIKLQKWDDATGKFSVSAKYIDHDPELKWVILRAVKGTGDERVVKDVTVPLEKLSKRCQSRVRQIAFLKPKIEAAIAAIQDTGEESEDGAQPMDEFGQRDAPMRSDRQRQPMRSLEDVRSVPEDQTPPTVQEPLSPAVGMPMAPSEAMRPVAESARRSDGRALQPAEDQPTSSADAPPAEEPPAGLAVQEPQILGAESWATDYEAFRSRFAKDQRGYATVDAADGPLRTLAELYMEAQQIYGPDMPDPSSRGAEIEERLRNEVGEFEWEATLAENVRKSNDWTKLLQLPPLPEPARLKFELDEKLDRGNWRGLHAGGRVRFYGRLVGFSGAHGIVAKIRFPPQRPASSQPPDADEGQ